jgi:hypothetical protein
MQPEFAARVCPTPHYPFIFCPKPEMPEYVPVYDKARQSCAPTPATTPFSVVFYLKTPESNLRASMTEITLDPCQSCGPHPTTILLFLVLNLKMLESN